MKIGIDYRPALVNREGIGRAVREQVRAHAAAGAPELALFGSTLAPARSGRATLGLGPSTRLSRLRLPSRLWQPLYRTTGLGADRLLGPVELFHHTQPALLPISRAAQTATLWDCLWKDGGSGWIAPEVAERMARSAARCVERCERLQVPSRFVRDEVVDVLGAEPERVDLVPLGADHLLEVEPRALELPPRPFLLTVARVDPRKNHAAVLDALRILVARGRDLDWLVVGPPGHDCATFLSALESSPVADRVRWLGAVSDGELVTLYRACACFVFPSLGEGFGLPPLEAAAFGAPVVSSDRGSLAEVLPPTAAVVDPNEPEAIAQGIEACLDSARPEPLHQVPTWTESARAQRDSWRRALDRAHAPDAAQAPGRLRSQTSS